MIQLRILSGKTAGNQTVVRHFPFRIGRATQNELTLDDPGVWDLHLTLDLQRDHQRFIASVAPNAVATINSQPIQNAPLRNGDVISFGSVKMQFWLDAVQQRSLRPRELFVWMLLAAVTGSQIFLVYWLLASP